MSRYVDVAIPLRDLETVASALRTLGIAFERGPVALQGSLECEGEPVDLRLAMGTCATVEDFGFVAGAAGVRLVCGELDRARLERELIPALTRVRVQALVQRAAAATDLEVETQRLPGGGRRIVLRRP